MPDLTFVTGNPEKQQIATAAFAAAGIELGSATLDIDEIQSHDGEAIVRDKAAKAHQALGTPVVVNDDTWSFAGLNGFPGPYMKYVADWLSADDFIRLTRHLADRRVTLTQWIAYHDGTTIHVIHNDYSGEVLPEARGTYGNSLQKVITMPGDNGLSVAEVYDNGASIKDREVTDGWNKFIAYYKGLQT